MLSFLFTGIILQAQMTVNGKVLNSDGKPIPGASVEVVGKEEIFADADLEGNYTLQVPADVAKDGIVTLRAVSKDSEKEIPINYYEGKTVISDFKFTAEKTLNEVVVIGYGTIKKKDATGSVTLITTEDMNKGPVVTADNLLTGRVAGVTLTPNGNPGSGSTIRIRGGASLNASNEPLLVVDGLPLQDTSLNRINPNDIESFSILKDASATAIYGSRASNGVILITTKRGSAGKWRFNYDGQFNYNEVPYYVDVLSSSQFVDLVNTKIPGRIPQLGLNGVIYNTDWQKEVLHNALATSHNLSARGNIGGVLPSRFTVGYGNTPGLLRTSSYERTNFSMALNPTFFDKHLKIDFNANAAFETYNKADETALSNAVFFDPTKPVRDPNSLYNGYFEWMQSASQLDNLAPRNPVALLEDVKNTTDFRKFFGNFQVDYKFHFFPDLRAVVNLGFERARWFDNFHRNAGAAANASDNINRESKSDGNGFYQNKLLDTYLNYVKDFNKLKVDVTAGYSYQNYNNGRSYTSGDYYSASYNPQKSFTDLPSEQRFLVSFFGRANLTYADKYLLTLTYRRDGSSLFSKDNRWGNFPAASFAWRMSDENFMKSISFISDLKLRAGWGITGQQALSNIQYFPLYGFNTTQQGQYIFGSEWLNVMYPKFYNTNLKWEETTTYNVGVDFGFLNNRITGTIDLYSKKSKDLLAEVDIAAGANFANRGMTNFGELTSKGAELGINWDIFKTKTDGGFNWDVNYNVSFNKLEVTKLYGGTDVTGVGGISGVGNGNYIQIHREGYAPNSFYVYKQVYDSNHKPIEGAFQDLNGDGVIDTNDRYLYKKPNADWTMGFKTNVSYKHFDFSMAWRASIGNYIYNNLKSSNIYLNSVNSSANFVSNILTDYYDNQFVNRDVFKASSDMFIENASFLKLDNVSVGYTFNKAFGEGTRVRLSASVSNVFTITDANVDDPEVYGGIYWNLYPRPRVYSFGFNLDF